MSYTHISKLKFSLTLSLMLAVIGVIYAFSTFRDVDVSDIKLTAGTESHAINEVDPLALNDYASQPATDGPAAGNYSAVKPSIAKPAAKAKMESEAYDLMEQRHIVSGQAMSMMTRHIAPQLAPQPAPLDRENYAAKNENRFLSVALSPLSTFGLEVDSASYSNVRRQINQGGVPLPSSVRLEEMVNYFDYNFPQPGDGHPISVMSDYAVAPWNPKHRLAMIGVKASDVTARSDKGARITFLLDTSGSMNSHDKLPLLIRSFQTLLANLKPQDQVAIVTYAGSAGLVLPPTPVTESERIHQALANLSAGGSTAGGAGIQLAYDVARKQYDKSATNLVILATDGDFNVGVSGDGELKSMIEKQRESGVFLSVIGMGSGNYQDAKMQVLAEAGNGVAHYLDSDIEAQRLFGSELTRTLHIAAKDVKVQIEFNPAAVAQYRLLGYESRVMNAEDFRDDKKDSGEIGAGHSVVALYEIIPAGTAETPDIERRYQTSLPAGSKAMELAYVKLRYKQPDGDKGIEFDHLMTTKAKAIEAASVDLQWASAVAELSLLLSESEHAGSSSLQGVLHRAKAVTFKQADAKRAEFIQLIERLSPMVLAQE
ncbi:von Willebrand factor type A domain-containing protein [Zhongshania sp.]|uniref:vWA domain-containing protein n=1 Tax=Zhongshania sp. TaxID=1971902 RepID=UPI001B6EA06F|nr:von Willebrand factor type A domain-containing protein [Zhongshania sp.]MBQ0797246.1 von Willebrand factor type A domain-containing protein [Zhongshania sp.]